MKANPSVTAPQFNIGDRVSYRVGFYDAIVTGIITERVSTEIATIYRVQIDDEFKTHFFSPNQTKYENHLTKVTDNEYSPKNPT